MILDYIFRQLKGKVLDEAVVGIDETEFKRMLGKSMPFHQNNDNDLNKTHNLSAERVIIYAFFARVSE